MQLRPLDGRLEFLRRAEEERPVDAVDEHVRRQHQRRLTPHRPRASGPPNTSSCTLTDSAMRRMKRSAAITTPTLTATTRSTKTVSPKVTSRTIRSERGARRSNRPKWRTSHMVQATKNRMAASAASGTCEAKGANSTMTSTRKTECTMPASGLVAPLRTFVAVRAIAPVAANPPKIGVEHVRDALPDQFLVRVVARAGHAVGDDGRQQRLDRAEQCDRERGPDELQHIGQRDLRPVQRGQGARNAAEGRADRRDARELPDRLHRGRDEHRDERRRDAPEARDAIEQAVAGDDDREREHRDAGGREVQARAAPGPAPRRFSWKCAPAATGGRPKKYCPLARRR